MLYEIPEEFQQDLDEFNDARGGPANVAVAWSPFKQRWQIWVVPVQESHHPDATIRVYKLLRTMPDGSGRRGILLNTWHGANGEYLPLDQRVFEALWWADSFRDRLHFENTIKRPEMEMEAAMTKKARDLAANAREYWYGLDNVIKSMNPAVSSPGDWRATRWWR